MSRVAVVLSGCGVSDGTEINEAVLSLLSLEQQGATYQCFAPDIQQMHVINHLTGEPEEGESRNVLTEAARIARGNDPDTAAAINAMGGEHLECPVSEARVDADRKLVTTPAYMLAGSVSEACAGISECVREVLAPA